MALVVIQMSKMVLALALLITAGVTPEKLPLTTKQRVRLGEELGDAAFNGDRSRVETLLAQGADIDYADQFGGTALDRAIDGQHAPTAKLLLDAGANPNTADIIGSTPLHGAAAIGETSIVELLIAHKADVNAQRDDGEAPLHWCRNSRIVRLLLNAHAEVNVAARDGTTPLHNASKMHRVEVVRVLLSAGAEVDSTDVNGWTPLFLAAERAHNDREDYETVAELLKAGANVAHKAAEGESVLQVAEGASVHNIQQLLRHGASTKALDANGDNPITVAAEHCRVDLIKFYQASAKDLILFGARGETSLDRLVKCQNIDSEALIQNTCITLRRPCEELEQMLIMASERDNVDLADQLLRDKVNPNCSKVQTVNSPEYKQESGLTPLMVAAFRGKNPLNQITVVERSNTR
jgi:ankyrin repeat protein